MSRRFAALHSSSEEGDEPFSLTAVITARLQKLMDRFLQADSADEMTPFDVEAETTAMRIHSAPSLSMDEVPSSHPGHF